MDKIRVSLEFVTESVCLGRHDWFFKDSIVCVLENNDSLNIHVVQTVINPINIF